MERTKINIINRSQDRIKFDGIAAGHLLGQSMGSNIQDSYVNSRDARGGLKVEGPFEDRSLFEK